MFNIISLLQFCRSAVGGSTCSQAHNGQDTSDLIFESRFESGNLAKVVKITSTYYELSLRSDMYTNRHTQWFYFRIENTKKNVKYRYESYILSIRINTHDSLNINPRKLVPENYPSKKKIVGKNNLRKYTHK